MSHESAKQIEAYSFLVAFAREGTLSEAELTFIEDLATRDGSVDDEEKKVLSNIFAKVPPAITSKEVWDEIQRFKAQWGIE